MTLSEFKAWFEGFSEIMDGNPDEKQWERIKARVAEINGSVTTYPVFVDRYVEPYRRYWPNVPYWSSCGTSPNAGLFNTTDSRVEYMKAKANGSAFNSSSAMSDLGRAEYKAMLDA